MSAGLADDNLMLMASMMGNMYGGYGGYGGGVMNNPLMMMQLMRNGGMTKCDFIPSLSLFCRIKRQPSGHDGHDGRRQEDEPVPDVQATAVQGGACRVHPAQQRPARGVRHCGGRISLLPI